MDFDFDLESEACLETTPVYGVPTSRASSRRFTPVLPRAPVAVPRFDTADHLVHNVQFSPPLLSHSVASSGSSSKVSSARHGSGHGGTFQSLLDNRPVYVKEQRATRIVEPDASQVVYAADARFSSRNSISVSDHVSTGLDERHRSRHYPRLESRLDDGPSPLDSASLVGIPARLRGQEYVASQTERNAARPGDDLAASLMLTSSRVSPATRRKVSVSSRRSSDTDARDLPLSAPRQVPGLSRAVRHSRVGSQAPVSLLSMPPTPAGHRPATTHYEGSVMVVTQPIPSGTRPSDTIRRAAANQRYVATAESHASTVRPPSRTDRQPRNPPASQAQSQSSSSSRMSKIIIDRKVLFDIANTEVADDINLRTISGHNVIVMRDGASFEVVDTDGNLIEPVRYEGPEERRAVGLPPITARDIHDTLKRASDGKYGVSRSNGTYRVVVNDKGGVPKKSVRMERTSTLRKLMTPI